VKSQPVRDLAEKPDASRRKSRITAPLDVCRRSAPCHSGAYQGDSSAVAATHGVPSHPPGGQPGRLRAPPPASGCVGHRPVMRRDLRAWPHPKPRPNGPGSAAARCTLLEQAVHLGVSKPPRPGWRLPLVARVAPSSRNTRRSWHHPARCRCQYPPPRMVEKRPRQPRCLGAATREIGGRAPRRPRPGTRSDTASSKLVLPEPFGPTSTLIGARGHRSATRNSGNRSGSDDAGEARDEHAADPAAKGLISLCPCVAGQRPERKYRT